MGNDSMGDPLTLCIPAVFQSLIGRSSLKCSTCIDLGATPHPGTEISCVPCPENHCACDLTAHNC